MTPSRSFSFLAASLGLLGLGNVASAQSQAYAVKSRTIRAAVLTLDSDRTGTATYGQTVAPYAFHNLELATGIKPGGWAFVNPFAPGAVTPEIRTRFTELGSANIPATGTLITKRNAAYWTVSLSNLSDAQISTYDVLLIAPRYQASLNAFEREKLRRFVDGGGVLWVDTGVGGLDGVNNLPFAIQRINATGNGASDPTSPLLNGPRKITGADLNLLNGPIAYGLAPVDSGRQNDIPIFGEFGRYRPAVWVGAYPGVPTMVSARLGDGAIVVTARGPASLLNGGPNNVTTYSGNDLALGASGRAAARLAVNIVALGNDFSQSAAGSHKQNSVAADPGSPVLSRFVAEGTFGPNDTVKSASGLGRSGEVIGAPVTYKGFLVASIFDRTRDRYRVVVMDAVPGRDLDGDGDEDDGIVNGAGTVVEAWRDNSIGRPLDVVWVSAEITQPISAPVCAEAPESTYVVNGVQVKDYVLVKQADGQLEGFQLNRAVNNRLVGDEARAPIFVVRPPDGAATVVRDNELNRDVVIPPTVYDGLVYVADVTNNGDAPQGRIWTVQLGGNLPINMASANSINNPAIGTPGTPGYVPQGSWYVGGPNATGAQALPAFTASPTIGYIPIQDNAGGQDRILYAPGYTGPGHQPAFASIWLGAKGEKPAAIDLEGTTLRITTRAGARGSLAIYNPGGTANSAVQQQLAPHLSITDLNGNPVAPASLGIPDTFVGADTGTMVYTLSGTLPANWETTYSFRVDYTIDWGHNPRELSANLVRGRLILPVNKTTPDRSSRILGPIALTPKGTLHFTQSSLGATGDTYWAVREDLGQGSFRVVTKYSLNSAYTQNFGSVAGTAVPAVLGDVDPVGTIVLDALRNLNIPVDNFNLFTRFRFAGGISVRNGIAYATINAQRNGAVGIPVMIVAAFRAEPETPEIRIGAGLGTNPRIVQADFARSDPGATGRAPSSSTLAGDRLNVDSENGVIRVESLASASREEITDSISLSQPIGLSADASPVTLRVPDRQGDRWSPLLWYGLWNGATGQGAPLVAGTEVFVGATTRLPQLLSPDPLQTNAESAVVWSVDADHPTTGTYAVPNPDRPWLIQAVQISTTSGFAVNPYYRMPQGRGVTTPQDYGLRLRQTTLGSSSAMYGVAGGNGSVVAMGNNGLYGMSRADFIVCDEGRLLRVDSSGNPIRTTFGGRFSGVGGGGRVAELRPLVRPVKAYPVGESNTLVVDAGANRVVLMDEDGSELRALDRITLDPNFKPAGYQANDPLTFSDPRDATTYEGYVYAGNSPAMVNQGPVEYWVRYIVADSGNGRLVELADRYTVENGRIGGVVVDGTGAPQVGVLVWQSPTLEGVAKIGTYYNSISRVFVGTFGTGRYVYVAGVSRGRATRSSAGLDNPNAGTRPANGGGAIVVFDPQGGARVFDRFQMPDFTNTAFLDRSDPTNYNYNVNTPASTPVQPNRPFTGLASVTAQTFHLGTESAVRVMAADANAVYEFTITAAILGDATVDPTGRGTLQPSWMINEAAFTALRPSAAVADTNPRFFRPLYARRLDSGEVLVVNGYRGTTFGNATYGGEVLLLNGASYRQATQNLGFLTSSIRFELPPLTGIRGLVSPVFADRR